MARKLKHIKSISVLVFFFVILAIMDLLGSLFKAPSSFVWAQNLTYPSWDLPPLAYGIVWPILYVLMALSLFFIWRKKSATNIHFWAYISFVLQIFLNLIWSFLFFGLRSPFLAMVDNLVLWLGMVFMLYVFWRISHTAVYLFIPYFIWMSYEVALSVSVWMLNR